MSTRLIRLAAAGAILLAATATTVSTAATPATAGTGPQIVYARSTIDSLGAKEAEAQCPVGTQILGGGGYITNPGHRVHLVRLQPMSRRNSFIAGAEEYLFYSENWIVYAYAICGEAPPGGVTFTSGSTVTDSSSGKLASVDCPNLLSSGFRIQGGDGDVKHQYVSWSGNNTIQGLAHEQPLGTSADWSLSVYGVCAVERLPLASVAARVTDSEDKIVHATCPPGTLVTGLTAEFTGALGEPSLGEMHLVGAYPNLGLKSATVVAQEYPAGISADWSVMAWARCR